jgi:mRNA interferase HicA
MKRRKLIKTIEEMGCILIRHGSNHDWYQNPETGFYQPVPRHSDINEMLAKQIIKKLQNF